MGSEGDCENCREYVDQRWAVYPNGMNGDLMVCNDCYDSVDWDDVYNGP